MRAHFTFASLLAFALCGLASRPAHAQSTCSADSDCVKGWTCQVSGSSGCTSPACAPGEKCDPLPSDCTSVEYKSCQPGACHVDSDCAVGMVCYTHTESDCAPNACASGQACPPPSCETRTESACVPRYVLPCTTASDCGAGFSCESAGEQCACSGSAGSAGGSEAPSDGRTPLPDPVPTPAEECVCEPSKELRCHAVSVDCGSDGDCPRDWSCAAVGATTDCASTPTPEPTPGGNAQGGSASGDGTPPPDCRPSQVIKQCVPPYYALVEGAHGVERDDAGGPQAGGDVASGSGNPAIPPSAESGDGDATSSAGCSVAYGSQTGSTLAVLGMLGLFGALRRRRAR